MYHLWILLRCITIRGWGCNGEGRKEGRDCVVAGFQTEVTPRSVCWWPWDQAGTQVSILTLKGLSDGDLISNCIPVLWVQMQSALPPPIFTGSLQSFQTFYLPSCWFATAWRLSSVRLALSFSSSVCRKKRKKKTPKTKTKPQIIFF